MKKLISYLLLLSLILNYGLLAQSITPEQSNQITQLINKQINGISPGIAVGIIKDGQIVFEEYAGYANLSHEIRVDEKTRFNIASVAKQFTAFCILKLAKEGNLSLEDDFRKYLPSYYQTIKESLPIKFLLNHSSGIRDYCDLMSIQGDPWWRREGLDNKDALQLIQSQNSLNFTPGSEYLYSNSNYTLLTEVVKVVSGMPFDRYAKELFSSLGMEQTHFLTNYMAVIPHLALPYTDWGDGIWQQYPMMTNLHGDGFLYTTLQDQLTFEKVLQNKSEEGSLLPTILASQKAIPDTKIQDYGFGLELTAINGYPAVHHSGGTGSYNAQIIRFPSEKISLVVMSNNGTIWAGNVAKSITRILLPKKGALDAKVSYPSRPDQVQPASPLTALVGDYLSPDEDIIRITMEKDQLYWQAGNNNPRQLTQEKGNLYHWTETEQLKIAFTDTTDDNSSFTVYYPGSEPHLHHKLVPFVPTESYLNDLSGNYKSKELNTQFNISYTGGSNLQFTRAGKEKIRELNIIQKDHLQLYDYKMKVERDPYQRVFALLISYNRVKNLRFERSLSGPFPSQQPTKDGGQISVNTTKESYGKGKGDILLTKTNAQGNEEWYVSFGGRSYELASSVLLTSDGGYLIVGSTSSYGAGNYDAWLIKTDAKGKKRWDHTYGSAANEYGFTVEELKNGGYLLKGKKQVCETDFTDPCPEYVWLIQIDANGELVSENLLEKEYSEYKTIDAN